MTFKRDWIIIVAFLLTENGENIGNIGTIQIVNLIGENK